MLYYDCPACKMRCETTDAFAGKTVFCPHCGKQVTVPSDAITTSPPRRPKPVPQPRTPDTGAIAAGAPPAPVPAAPAPTEGAGGGSGMRNFILVLGGIGVLVFLAIWFLPGNTGDSGGGGGPSNPDNPVVVMDTSMGTIKIELFQDSSPISTANFLRYVAAKHYDGTVFHRVIKDFMIQGGGFGPDLVKGEKKTFKPIRNEASNGVKNERGTIAMARTSNPDSATAQFFINTADNSRKLGPGGVDAHGYAVFGKVIGGMDVVDAIRMLPTRSVGDHDDVPIQPVIIQSVRLVETRDGAPNKK